MASSNPQKSAAWLKPRRPVAAMLIVAATGASLLFALAVTFGLIAA